ncbi:hypothetical protein BH23BAC1_BH23BAC1_30940 [soil metagenome]
MLKFFWLLIICFFVGLQNIKAQRQVERLLILNPLFDTTKTFNGRNTSWAHSFNGWIGFNKYTIAKDNDHEWFQQIGTMTEIVRFRNNSSITFTGHMEMVADPHNNINLNPRAIFWEEGLFYIKKVKDHYLKFGYYHRCKHDIDNLEVGQQRTTIYASLLFETIKPVKLPENDLILALRTEFYTVRQDYRLPRMMDRPAPDVNNLLGSFRGNFHYQKLFSNTLGVFLNGYAKLLIYSQHEGFVDRLQSFQKARVNSGLSGGLVINGNANIRLAVNYDYLSDTGIPIFPVSGHFISFGVMGRNPLTIR